MRGRLLRDDEVGAYQEAFPQMRKLAGLKPIDGRLWVVIEGEHPGEDRGALIVGLLLLAFAGLNVVLALQGARALLHMSATAKDRGEHMTQFSAMAKLSASRAAMWVTTQAIQIFGGYGYVSDYPVERLFRDAKVTEIYEGTSEIQRIVIARELYSHR